MYQFLQFMYNISSARYSPVAMIYNTYMYKQPDK